MYQKGYIKKDIKTKNLIKRLKPGDVPVLLHEDIDEVAAYSLIDKKVKLVINCAKSFTGKYPANGVKILIENNVEIIDDMGQEFYDNLNEGDIIEIEQNKIYINKEYICDAKYLDVQEFNKMYTESYKNMEQILEHFIQNTLEYAKQEKWFILSSLELPDIKVNMFDKHVLVVTRGIDFKKDIKAIKNYIFEVKPIIIAVDGAADALIEEGFLPHIILGDMDSVSEKALLSCKEIIVHSYTNGHAPGLKKVKELGLEAKTIACPGTSEDVALLLAYEKGAELIVSVGSHSNIVDFLEKGRKGMASTFLVRLKVGPKLVDAKGVSRLYSEKFNLKYFIMLFLAALIPLFAILLTTPPFQYFLYFLQIKLRTILR